MSSFAQQGLCPIMSDGLEIEESGSDVIVFDRGTNQFHLLNVVAHTILKASNGVTPPKNIALALAHTFDLQGRSLRLVTQDVITTLDQLHAKGLVAYVAEADAAHTIANALESGQEEASSPPSERPLFAVAVEGSSMFPVLVSGDRVVVRTIALDDLAIGDIVVWSRGDGKRIAHRVIVIERDPEVRITTKGDTVLHPDPPMEFRQLLGKAVAVLREGDIQWMRTLDRQPSDTQPTDTQPTDAQTTHAQTPHAQTTSPSGVSGLKVLDLRDMSAEAIRSIGPVEEVSLVLLSPRNAHAWPDVSTRDVSSVLTVPDDYRVYTGQPELLTEMLPFLQAPIRLVVSGQLFLCAFEPEQITQAFAELILSGQAYVRSAEAKAALEAVTTVISGGITIVPSDHVRWIGESILGPEYPGSASSGPAGDRSITPLVAIGDLAISDRMASVTDRSWLFN